MRPAIPSIVVLLCCAGCDQGYGDDPYCGDTRSAASPVRNGTDHPEAVTMTDAQIASVGQIKIGDPAGYTSCSAALVAPSVVLTAGHCLDDPATTYITFNSGVNYLSPDHSFEASSWHMHPSYPGGGSGPRYDIGVVILRDDATTAGLVPIPASSSVQSLVGQTIQAVGYGRTMPDVSGNTIRYWTTLPVVDETSLVYTADGEGVTGLCVGDSGGPMIWEVPGEGLRVMGVLSNGDSSDCMGHLYFPRTDAYQDFLAGFLPSDPCAGETLVGRCAGDATAVYCADATVHTDVCGPDESCRMGSDGLYRCALLDDCALEGLDHAGTCTADGHARWCDGGVVRDRNCALCGQTCGWASDELGYYCI